MSRPGRYLKLLIRDPVRRERWLSGYVHHRNLYAKGHAEIGGAIAIVNFQGGMITWLFLKSIFPAFPVWILAVGLAVIIVGRTVLKWYVGYYWDRYKIFDREMEWQNSRNPTLKGLVEEVRNGHI